MGETAAYSSPPRTYAQDVGARLRRVRRQLGLSLQEVEAKSEQEFKASVLGAYERGERVISVLRLERLAGRYGVPVDFLLPNRHEPLPVSRDGTDPPTESASRPWVTFDLLSFDGVNQGEAAMVRRYLYRVQAMRRDHDSHRLAIRADDLVAMARMLDLEVTALLERLEYHRAASSP